MNKPIAGDYVSLTFQGTVTRVEPRSSMNYKWTEVWIKNDRGQTSIVPLEEAFMRTVMVHRPWPKGPGSVIKLDGKMLALSESGEWRYLTDGVQVTPYDTAIEIVHEIFEK